MSKLKATVKQVTVSDISITRLFERNLFNNNPFPAHPRRQQDPFLPVTPQTLGTNYMHTAVLGSPTAHTCDRSLASHLSIPGEKKGSVPQQRDGARLRINISS